MPGSRLGHCHGAQSLQQTLQQSATQHAQHTCQVQREMSSQAPVTRHGIYQPAERRTSRDREVVALGKPHRRHVLQRETLHLLGHSVSMQPATVDNCSAEHVHDLLCCNVLSQHHQAAVAWHHLGHSHTACNLRSSLHAPQPACCTYLRTRFASSTCHAVSLQAVWQP